MIEIKAHPAMITLEDVIIGNRTLSKPRVAFRMQASRTSKRLKGNAKYKSSTKENTSKSKRSF